MSRVEGVEQAHQIKEFLSPKRGSTGCHDIGRVLGDQIRPSCGDGMQMVRTVSEDSSVVVPVQAAQDEVEFLAKQRVERMGHPKRSSLDGPNRRS